MAVPNRERGIRCWRALRKEKSFLQLHPLDAYLYVLQLLGKRDPKLVFRRDVTLLFYLYAGQGRLEIDKALSLASVIEDEVDAAEGTRPVGRKLLRDVLPEHNGVLAFPDFLYCASFEDDSSAAIRTFGRICKQLDVFADQARGVVGRHAYAAVQLVSSIDPKEKRIDDCFEECERHQELPPARRLQAVGQS